MGTVVEGPLPGLRLLGAPPYLCGIVIIVTSVTASDPCSAQIGGPASSNGLGEGGELVVHGAQVLRLKVDIAARHFQSGVPKDSLKPEHVPPVSDVVQSEGVAEGVEADPDSLYPELLAHNLEPPQNVTLRLVGPFRRRKHQGELV
jgi:hypothetical protein